MLTVLTSQWPSETPGREFLPAHVNVLRRQFARCLGIPHRVVCISDANKADFDPEIRVIPTPAAAAAIGDLKSPEGSRFPSCYRRLWAFSRAAGDVLGDWILQVDIDLVLTADITRLVLGPYDDYFFVGWRPRARWGNPMRIAGGLWMMRQRVLTKVWDDFAKHPAAAIAAARKAGYRGSDQAWLSYCVNRAGHEPMCWAEDEGIYSIRDFANGKRPLPADARLVQFNGPTKPWDSALPWVKEHWR